MSCHCIPNGQVTVKGSTIDIGKSGSVDKQTKMLEEHLKIISQTMCNWAQPETTDTGENWEKVFWKAALIAIATLNSAAQIAIADQRYQIAKDYANIAKDRWNRFKDSYAPLERAMLSEAGNMREYDPDYDAARARAREFTTAAFRTADDQMADLANKYGLCIDESMLNDMDYAEAVARDDGTNFNYRDEEFFSLYVSDKRWNNRSQLLNLGRGLQATAASYAEAANTALAQFGDMLNSGAQGAMKLFGYLSTARETQYPAQFSAASPLTGQASSSLGGSALLMGPLAAI